MGISCKASSLKKVGRRSEKRSGPRRYGQVTAGERAGET